MMIKLNISEQTAAAVDNISIGIRDIVGGPGISVGVDPGKDLSVGINKNPEVTIKIDKKPPIRIELQGRRTLEGNILILDHEDIDIVVMPAKKKCITFAKDLFDDKIYGAQDRLFKFLSRKGVVDPSTVRAGNVYGSLEGAIYESKIPGVDEIEAVLYTVYRYITEEKPYFMAADKIKDEEVDMFLTPDPDQSTELGEIPHADKKGAMATKQGAFGHMYNPSLVREAKKKK